MKDMTQISEARDAVCRQLERKDISEAQRTVLRGMSVALCWVADEGGTTLAMLVAGRPVDGVKP